MKSFVVLSNNIVTGVIGVHDEKSPMAVAMSENPIIVPISEEQHQTIDIGWRYTGAEFIAPQADSGKGLVFASSQLADSRYEICLDCPRFNHKTKQCLECGCFMVAKTKLSHAKCPLSKW